MPLPDGTMSNRLTRIYTRSGDRGETGLGDGSRQAKNAPRVEAIGECDELNSMLGLLATYPLEQPILQIINTIQNDLFDLGGELSIPGNNRLGSHYIEWLEQQIDQLNGTLPPLKEFILPGGTPAAATCHLARTICRRAERRLVSLLQQDETVETPLQYLNRLSDLLFVMARTIARTEGEEVLWNPGNRGS